MEVDAKEKKTNKIRMKRVYHRSGLRPRSGTARRLWISIPIVIITMIMVDTYLGVPPASEILGCGKNPHRARRVERPTYRYM
jgi:hypothetical protein